MTRSIRKHWVWETPIREKRIFNINRINTSMKKKVGGFHNRALSYNVTLFLYVSFAKWNGALFLQHHLTGSSVNTDSEKRTRRRHGSSDIRRFTDFLNKCVSLRRISTVISAALRSQVQMVWWVSEREKIEEESAIIIIHDTPEQRPFRWINNSTDSLFFSRSITVLESFSFTWILSGQKSLFWGIFSGKCLKKRFLNQCWQPVECHFIPEFLEHYPTWIVSRYFESEDPRGDRIETKSTKLLDVRRVGRKWATWTSKKEALSIWSSAFLHPTLLLAENKLESISVLFSLSLFCESINDRSIYSKAFLLPSAELRESTSSVSDHQWDRRMSRHQHTTRRTRRSFKVSISFLSAVPPLSVLT